MGERGTPAPWNGAEGAAGCHLPAAAAWPPSLPGVAVAGPAGLSAGKPRGDSPAGRRGLRPFCEWGQQAAPGGAPSPGAARSPPLPRGHISGVRVPCVVRSPPPPKKNPTRNSESYEGKINISQGFGAEGRASGAEKR